MSGNLIKLKINNKYELDIMNYLTYMNREVKNEFLVTKIKKTNHPFANPSFYFYYFTIFA